MPSESKRILIVENDIDALTLIYTTLLPLDFALEAAIDSSELRLRVERFQPDLILLGTALGDVDEQELCLWIKRNYNTRVIGIGKPAEVAHHRPGELCLDDILEKPVCPHKLLTKLNHLLPV